MFDFRSIKFYSKDFLYYLCYLLIIAYALAPGTFEKYLYVNELLSLTGFMLFMLRPFVYIRNNSLYNYIILLLAYIALFWVVSFFNKDSLYAYLRTSVLFYSIFSFFVGYYAYERREILFKLINLIIRKLLIVGSFVVLPIHRISLTVLLPFIYVRKNIYLQMFLIAVFNLLIAYTYSGQTSIVVALFFFSIMLIRKYKQYKYFSLILMVSFFIFFFAIAKDLSLIKSHDIGYVMRSNKLLSIDGNTTWRLVLWYQVLLDKLPQNILGIGFGTPMFEADKIPISDYSKIAIAPYVTGAHNSFIYLLGRIGILYLIFALLIYVTVMKEYFTYGEYYVRNNSIFFFYSFFTISLCACLNVIMESPMHASLYWIFLGLVAKSIWNRRKIHHESIINS